MTIFPALLNLSSLDSGNGFAINGTGSYDTSGSSVSSAGDINGDGFDDVIIGAPNAGPTGSSGLGTGEAYVVFGSSEGFSTPLDVSTLDGTNGFVITGKNEGDRLGSSVAGAGDINNDGTSDLIVSAPNATSNGNTNAGETYVIFGNNAGFSSTFNPSALNGSNGFTISGASAGDLAGFSTSGIGDFNKDGVDDLAISALGGDPTNSGNAGATYVVFGSSTGFGSNLNLAALNSSSGLLIDGIDQFDPSGFFVRQGNLSVSGAGDINNDGTDDLIIGSYFRSIGLNPVAGESYVVFGNSAGFGSSFDLSTLNGTNGFELEGIDNDNWIGFDVSGAGDINDDGIDDLVVSSNYVGFPDAGETYIIFGSNGGFSSTFDVATLDGTNGFVLEGTARFGPFGIFSGPSVSNAGDINNDGIEDIIVGSPGADPNGNTQAGESYVLFGSSTGFSSRIAISSLDGTNGFVIAGIESTDYLGSDVSDAGDVNGDGVDDLIIGANSANSNGVFSNGASYVVFGRNNTPTPGDDAITGTADDDTIDALAGNDAVEGLGGNDTISGGDGSDTLDGGDGDDRLLGNEGDDALFGGAGNDQLGGIGGNDTLTGGAGNDFYTLNSTDDSVVELADEGTDRIQTTVDLTLVDNVEELTLIEGTTATSGTGNSLDNKLFGNSASNALSGEAGNDVLFGRAGSDTLTGGDGNDVLFGGADDDLLTGGAGIDVLFGGDGSDTFIFDAVAGVDAIRDFDTAMDFLDLSGLLDSVGYTGDNPIDDGYLRFGVSGNDTFVQLDVDGTGNTSQMVNLAVLKGVTDTSSLQVGQNVLV